mgnify:CR=1 FL=1
MLRVLLALCPATLAHIWFFGPGLAFNMAIAVTACVGGEALILRLRQRPVGAALGDLSAVVTGVLLAFCLPPLTPWWITVCGGVFAIVRGLSCGGPGGPAFWNASDGTYTVDADGDGVDDHVGLAGPRTAPHTQRTCPTTRARG